MPKILIDRKKCINCGSCEMVCSFEHTGEVNPQRSRIRIIQEGLMNIPVIAGPYTEAACNSQHIMVIEGRELDACIFCRASCPAKPIFKEPDTEIPLKCDFCGEPPDPSCVKVCLVGALTLKED